MTLKSQCALLAALSLAGVSAYAGDVQMLHHHHIVIPRPVAEPDASTPPSTAITPSQMLSIYGFSSVSNQGSGQIIGIVDAYDDPNAEADLGVFSTQYGLPSCTTANGCFKKIYATGKKPLGSTSWGQEISLDVQWAHAIAPQAKIYLVEASSSSNSALYQAVDVAVANGANVVSMSFGGSDSSSDTTYDTHFQVSGVTFVASAGDSNHGVEYPAASPYVIGVGGTSLTHNGGTYESEVVWNTKRTEGTGGGVSSYEEKPSYQVPFQSQNGRGVPDLAYDADPNTGVAIYDSYGGYKWVQIGGTSMGAPEIAAMIAIINSTRASSGKGALNFPADVYSYTADYHDITVGNNGTCGTICDAEPGYDFTTGVGTPIANVLIPALAAAAN